MRLIASNQWTRQGSQSLVAPRSRMLSANPSTHDVQDQNPSAEVAQANGVHLVTSLNDWSFGVLFSSVKNIPRSIETVESSRPPSPSATTGPLCNGFLQKSEAGRSTCRVHGVGMGSTEKIEGSLSSMPGPGKRNVASQARRKGGPYTLALC